MATTITKSIGVTGRDYSTIQAFFDAIPANLVTADELWEGVIYPDAGNEYTNQALTLSARTTDSTRFVRLKAASGYSFTEHANKLTNALRPNASNGILLSAPTSQASPLLNVAANIEFIGLQIEQRSTQSGSYQAIYNQTGVTTIRECIVQALNQGIFTGTAGSSSVKAYNSVFVGNGLGTGGTTTALTMKGCTFATSTAGQKAIHVDYNPQPLVKDCAFFGYTVASYAGGGFATGSSNNATDLASFPGGMSGTTSLTFADQFENTDIAGGTHDFRLKSGNSIATSGTADSDITLDIVGTTRHASTPSIGSWEYAAAGDTTAPTLTSPTGTQTGSTTASGTVSTDEANGTLYYLASTNATETAVTVKAASSQAVSGTGSQSVSFTGLTASTTYYAHYCHRDAAANDSTVSNSASFTTAAASSAKSPAFYQTFIAGR